MKKAPPVPVHSEIGASSMDRWSVCPGSRNFLRGKPAPPKEYAAQGTLAHKIAEECLRKGGNADSYLGEKHSVEGFDFIVDQDMVDAVQIYLDTARATRDFAEPGVLYVIDYKHGAGKFVDVWNNNQLRYYAYGALATLPFFKSAGTTMWVEHRFDLSRTVYKGLYGTADCVVCRGDAAIVEVEIVLVQPRHHIAESVRRQRMRVVDLLDYSTDLVAFAKATEAPDAPLVAGSHCRETFCPAQATCPALAKRADVVAAQVFALQPQQIEMQPAEIAAILDGLPMLEARIKAFREFAYAAVERHPGLIPGWKLVDKVARRAWLPDTEKVSAVLMLEGGLDSVAILEEPALRGITEMEKLLKDAGIAPVARKTLMDSITVKQSSGHTLVPESDSRPAVVKQSAVEVFANAPLQLEK